MHTNSIRNSPESRLLSLSRLGTTSQSFKTSKETEASGHSKIVLLPFHINLDLHLAIATPLLVLCLRHEFLFDLTERELLAMDRPQKYTCFDREVTFLQSALGKLIREMILDHNSKISIEVALMGPS